jgi:nitrogenase molybdenum-iron protein alpha/beta subunit
LPEAPLPGSSSKIGFDPTLSPWDPIGLRETDSFPNAGRNIRKTDPIIDTLEEADYRRLRRWTHPSLIKGPWSTAMRIVIGLCAFLAEIRVKPVLCASGGRSRRLEQTIRDITEDLLPEPPIVMEGIDFYQIAEYAESLNPQILIGSSKGYQLSRQWKIPLIRVGFIHDRFGGHRILHLGYRGAQMLLDGIVNAVIEAKQENSHVGYSCVTDFEWPASSRAKANNI